MHHDVSSTDRNKLKHTTDQCIHYSHKYTGVVSISYCYQLSSYLASCTYIAATNTQLFHLLHFRFSSFLLPLPISSSVCIRVLHVCRERNRKAKIQSMWLCTEDIFGDLHHNRSKIAELFQILERKWQDERAKVRGGPYG